MITLDALFQELDRHTDRVPLDDLRQRLEQLQYDWHEFESSVKFGRDTYRRNLMRSGPAYHALVLCWRNGQRSPIHDHFGSGCAGRVLQGAGTETIFERT